MENRLLACLPEEELERLSPQLERVELDHGQHVIVPDEPIRDIYFPLNCLLSLVTILEDGSSVESGTIGREGMSGVPVLLDAAKTTMPTFVQVPGDALRVRSSIVKEMYDEGGPLSKLLNRYIHTVIVTGSQSAACNARHSVEQRLCRWLLMSSDGVGSDEVNLTQEFLATMLGVRRPGVSVAAGVLQDAGLISYSRGTIQIHDRAALERSACECYRMTKEEYDRLFGR
ncbi:MAG TPA: Crp/Fnr family transcriptional regulator [Pyrinomonadaceae bacterium]|nr:Crp/Fnr family transcriptional regulator [Pyrinomonadaceae bacterium]